MIFFFALLKWSSEILAETTRTLEHKFGWPSSLVAYFESEVRRSFPDALVEGCQTWLPEMSNHPKDRHVVAVAIAGRALMIGTFNLRHFKPVDLAKWNVAAAHPQHLLREMFERRSSVVRQKMQEQADRRKISMAQLLNALRTTVPEFVDLIES